MAATEKGLFGIIGANPVGLAISAGLVEQGHTVITFDSTADHLQNKVNKFLSPMENASSTMLRSALQQGQWEVTNEISKLDQVPFIIDCISENEDSLREMVERVIPFLSDHSCYVVKSTVPMGTGDALQEWLNETGKKVEVISYPEFQREGPPLLDFRRTPHIILGGDVLKPGIHSLRRILFRDSLPILMTTRREAELIKLAASAFVATKISFVNQMASICEEMGADIVTVARTLGIDPGVGQSFFHIGMGTVEPYLNDLEITIEQATRKSVKTPLFNAVKEINQDQRSWVIKQLIHRYPTLEEKNIAVWGVDYEGDIRFVLEQLSSLGATIQLHYSSRIDHLLNKNGPVVQEYGCPMESLHNADALVILSNSREYIETDLSAMKKQMRTSFIVDGRSLFPPGMMKDRGFEYVSVGRKV